jgi:RNA polymerase sigma-70 factor, ECF subfamily
VDYLIVPGLTPSDLEDRFGNLITEYGPALRRLSRAYLQDPFEQQDLFQEIALALWSALPGYRGSASERTWIYRVAHNVALSFRAKHQRRHSREEPLEDAAIAPGFDCDERRILYEMVRNLPVLDRQIVLLHLEGLTGPEIAEVTGFTAGNVAVRLTRVRHRLAEAVRVKEAES